MLHKLALSGIKHRLKDYAVLFSGLLISAAIFYMFQALALNQKFLKTNSPIAVTPIVFQLGTVLLVVITLIYVLYANNFLMSMRQKDYGMFLMLGAKPKTIRQLVIIETVLIGSISLLGGVLVGLGLTQLVAQALAQKLQTSLTGFQVFYGPALFMTVLVLGLIFILAACQNSWKISHTPVLQLVKPVSPKISSQPKTTAGQVVRLVLGIVSLIVGYWMMGLVNQLAVVALVISLITVSLGTYLIINTFFKILLNHLRSSQWALRGLHEFTLGQLNFRITDYTKILTIVSLLFSLALGALSVGMSFQQNVRTVTDHAEYYDVTVNNPTRHEKYLLQQLKQPQQTRYQYKIQAGHVYLMRQQLHQQPFKYLLTNNQKVVTLSPSIQQMQRPESEVGNHLQHLLVPQALEKSLRWVDQANFAQIKQTTNQLLLIKTADFYQNTHIIAQLVASQQRRFPMLKDQGAMPKFLTYQMINEMYSGLEFMGFFLGFAFLAMLASCLMFKVLSGANQDRQRYVMLQKIGTRKKLLTISLRQELGVLFGIPAGFGIINLLFGLRLFKPLLHNPYQHLWWPITIFILLYALYYLVTVGLYQVIVLGKKE